MASSTCGRARITTKTRRRKLISLPRTGKGNGPEQLRGPVTFENSAAFAFSYEAFEVNHACLFQLNTGVNASGNKEACQSAQTRFVPCNHLTLLAFKQRSQIVLKKSKDGLVRSQGIHVLHTMNDLESLMYDACCLCSSREGLASLPECLQSLQGSIAEAGQHTQCDDSHPPPCRAA